MPAFPRSTAFRTFSALARARSVIKMAEPHPFERNPVTQQAAKADWGRHWARAGNTALFYFPFMGTFLAWPLVAEKAFDGRMGAY